MIRTFAKAAFAALILSATLSGVAEARQRPFVAQLAQPVAERVQIVADGAIWTCEGDACRAQVEGSASIAGCRTIAREVGTLTSYGSATNPLAENRLASCNTAAPAAQTLNADASN